MISAPRYTLHRSPFGGLDVCETYPLRDGSRRRYEYLVVKATLPTEEAARRWMKAHPLPGRRRRIVTLLAALLERRAHQMLVRLRVLKLSVSATQVGEDDAARAS